MCFACHRELSSVPTGTFACAHCGERYEAQPMRLKTESDKHLFRMYGRKYLLNKVLNNNGFISYSLFPEGNVSVPDRQDVIRFRKFIQSEVRAGSILDIGCGPLPLAGYLRFADESAYSFIGLDPIDGTSHEGYRIVGASELIPLRDRSVDAAVFGTSLDHVCDLKRSIREARRVVKDDGRILVWMGDSSQPLRRRIRAWLGDMRASLRLGYPVRRYKVYRNFMVLEVPRGAIDPFHSHLESPKKIIREFEAAGCRLVQHEFHSREEHFMSFAGRPLTPA
jgi:ubiquinone/menaquinone biosynthesis C-methylase UbiE